MPYQATEGTRAAREQRSRQLLDAARSIVAREGFRAATVKAVARVAGVSAGSVYTYFDTRETLLVAVFREYATVELEAVRSAISRVSSASATAELTALVEVFAHRAIRGHFLAWALLVEPVDAAIDAERLEYRRAYSEAVARIVRTGVRSGEFPEQDERIVGAGIVGAIGEALTGPLSPLDDVGATGPSAADAVVNGILALCLRAVGAPPAAGDRHP